MGYQMPVFGLDQLQTNTAMQVQVPNIDFAGIVNDGLATYDNLTNRRKQGILSSLIAQNIDPKTGQVDYQKAMQQSRTMPFANENVGKFGQAMVDVIAGQRKAQQDAMVLQSKLQKEAAETQKNYADATKTGGEAATNKLGNINNMFRQAMAIGKPNLAGSILQQGVISGAITQDDADGILGTFNTLPTEQQQSFIQGAALGGVDPKFQFGTVDNQLDNETSRENNTQDNQTLRNITGQKIAFGYDELNQAKERAAQDYELGLRQLQADANKPKELKLSSGLQKELFAAEDALFGAQNAKAALAQALTLSASSYQGVGALQAAKVVGNTPYTTKAAAEKAKNTILLDNIVTAQALEQLKAAFGAAPTEGERKILLDIQGSVNLPSEAREAIYKRAQALLATKETQYSERINKINSGAYSNIGGKSGGQTGGGALSFFQ